MGIKFSTSRVGCQLPSCTILNIIQIDIVARCLSWLGGRLSCSYLSFSGSEALVSM